MIIILSFVGKLLISLMICPLGLFIIKSNNERTDNEMENAVTKREKSVMVCILWDRMYSMD